MNSPTQSSETIDVNAQRDAADPPRPASIELKILLWNTWLLPSLITDRLAATRARAISPLLNAYDIVVLNEAFSNKKALLAETSHRHRYTPPAPMGRVVGSGLLFLSKHEIVETGWDRFARTAGVDRFAAKGVGYVVVQVEGLGKVQVFGTHMQAGASKGSQGARKAQAVQAGEFVRRERAKGGDGEKHAVMVFAGDLNMGPRMDEAHERISVHYVDKEDAKARCEAYDGMVGRAAGLVEVECEQGEEYAGDICRFLVKGVEKVCGEVKVRYEDLKGKDGLRLSDTKPLCLTLTIKEEPDIVKSES